MSLSVTKSIKMHQGNHPLVHFFEWDYLINFPCGHFASSGKIGFASG